MYVLFLVGRIVPSFDRPRSTEPCVRSQAADLGWSVYGKSNYYLGMLSFQMAGDTSRNWMKEYFDIYFPCEPLADADGDGVLGEPSLDGSGLLDCDDNDPEIDGCRGICEDADLDGIPDGCDPCTGGDPDNDGAQSTCDNCPTVWNPPDEYGRQADADGDGLGDACDWCTDELDAVPNQLLANCNLENELALYYPGQTAPPLVDNPSDLATYQAAFKVGSCEVGPCPEITLDDQGQVPPNAAQPGWEPCVNEYGAKCTYTAVNKIVHRPIASKVTYKEYGDVATKWCNCPVGDRSTLEGRARCLREFGCRGTPASFSSAAWLDIQTTDGTNTTWEPGPAGSPLVTEAESASYFFNFLGTPGQWSQPPVTRIRLWNYEALPTAVLGAGPGGTKAVTGVLWNGVRTFLKINEEDPFLDRDISERGNSLAQGDGGFVQDWTGEKAVGDQFWRLPLMGRCPVCFEGIASYVLSRINPGQAEVLPVRPDGVSWAARTRLTSGTYDTLTASLATNGVIVAASEPLGRLGSRDPGGVELRGVMVSGTGTPQWTLEAVGLSGAPQATRFGERVIDSDVDREVTGLDEAPEGLDREGLVLSAERTELYRLGSGDQHVQSSAVTITYLDSGASERRGITGSVKPADVLAATYRMEDRRVYIVDHLGPLTRLLRWLPGSKTMEMLAVWPAAWRAFDSSWLVAGSDGDLVYAATRADKSLIARFHVTGTGQVRFAGLKLLPERIWSAPFSGRASVVYAAVSGNRLVQRSVPFKQLKASPWQWCPQVQ